MYDVLIVSLQNVRYYYGIPNCQKFFGDSNTFECSVQKYKGQVASKSSVQKYEGHVASESSVQKYMFVFKSTKVMLHLRAVQAASVSSVS